MSRINKIIFFSFLFFSVSVVQLKAQEIRKNVNGQNSSKEIVIRIKGLADENFSARIESILNDYKGKIRSYAFNKPVNEISIVISDKIEIKDVLELFELNGITAGYIDENNKYITLSEDGELAEPINAVK